MKTMKKHFKKILAVTIAVIIMLAMAVTVAAQESPAEENQPDGEMAAMSEQAPEAEEQAGETPVVAEPPADPSPSAAAPEAPEAPEPSETPEKPEPSETPEPAPSADGTAAPADGTAAPEPSAPAESAPPQEEQAEAEPAAQPEQAEQPAAPAQPDETEALAPAGGEEKETPSYDAPAIFLTDIVAKGNNDTLALTEEQLAEIEKDLPENLSPYRREIVLKAYSLVGKVHYFWGGKSTASGWDIRWGNDAIVGSAGSSQTGTVRSYGLDCSGYVLWCMLNAEEAFASQQELAFDQNGIVNQTGYGTAGQWAHSYEITWEEAQPGDIVFYKNPQDAGINHVGILVGTDEEEGTLVAHCSSSKNSVVISPLEGSGFRYVRRLAYMDERETMQNQQEKAEIKVSTAPNGLPLMLTEEQAYEGAVLNGWAVN